MQTQHFILLLHMKSKSQGDFNCTQIQEIQLIWHQGSHWWVNFKQMQEKLSIKHTLNATSFHLPISAAWDHCGNVLCGYVKHDFISLQSGNISRNQKQWTTRTKYPRILVSYHDGTYKMLEGITWYWNTASISTIPDTSQSSKISD